MTPLASAVLLSLSDVVLWFAGGCAVMWILGYLIEKAANRDNIENRE